MALLSARMAARLRQWYGKALGKRPGSRSGSPRQTDARLVWLDGSPVAWSRQDRHEAAQFDIFISHAHRSGQDQARILKLQFERLLPNRNVFLDLDILHFSVQRLEEYVQQSVAMVVLLTGSTQADGQRVSDYFASKNCQRELHAALKYNVPIVFLLETDLWRGVPLEVHAESCRDWDPIVHWELFGGEEQDCHVPIIRWMRQPAFMLVSLRLVLQNALLPTQLNASTSPRSGGIVCPRGPVGAEMRLSTELPQRAVRMPRPHVRYHLFASEQTNRGVRALVHKLQSEMAHGTLSGSAALQCTTDDNAIEDAACVLFYLDAHTFAASARRRSSRHRKHSISTASTTTAAAAAAAAMDDLTPLGVLIDLALQKSRHVVLAHDGETSFDEILQNAPERIQETLLANVMSIPVYSGDFESTSLRLLLMQIELAAESVYPVPLERHSSVLSRSASLTRASQVPRSLVRQANQLTRIRRQSYVCRLVEANASQGGLQAGRLPAAAGGSAPLGAAPRATEEATLTPEVMQELSTCAQSETSVADTSVRATVGSLPPTPTASAKSADSMHEASATTVSLSSAACDAVPPPAVASTAHSPLASAHVASIDAGGQLFSSELGGAQLLLPELFPTGQRPISAYETIGLALRFGPTAALSGARPSSTARREFPSTISSVTTPSSSASQTPAQLSSLSSTSHHTPRHSQNDGSLARESSEAHDRMPARRLSEPNVAGRESEVRRRFSALLAANLPSRLSHASAGSRGSRGSRASRASTHACSSTATRASEVVVTTSADGAPEAAELDSHAQPERHTRRPSLIHRASMHAAKLAAMMSGQAAEEPSDPAGLRAAVSAAVCATSTPVDQPHRQQRQPPALLMLRSKSHNSVLSPVMSMRESDSVRESIRLSRLSRQTSASSRQSARLSRSTSRSSGTVSQPSTPPAARALTPAEPAGHRKRPHQLLNFMGWRHRT